ncbi:hypothetical protein BGZ49_000930 [Haplosporangium sp. Z 27]|nr:hypothetical protein BGZ49_000930 [Haplosporangium sp. Z 27]
MRRGIGTRRFSVEKKAERRRKRRAEKKAEKTEESTSTFFINPEIFVKQKYDVNGVDIGAIFLNHQRRSANVVNDSTATMNTGDMDSFLAMNSIWNTEFQLKDLDIATHKKIKEVYNWNRAAFTDESTMLCMSLDREMESTGRIKPRSASDDFQEDIIHIYQTLIRKLSRRALSFVQDYEDIFAHSSMDALFTTIFPANGGYDLAWANRSADGSKERRGDPLKSDATILKSGYELAFVEVKFPKEDHTARPYLEDLWKLANFCKDAIDTHIKYRRDFIVKTAGIQIYVVFVPAICHAIIKAEDVCLHA